MDRAWIVRVICRRLLLAAVLVQATTPDLLELSLLGQSLPPGRLSVSMSESSPRPSLQPERLIIRSNMFKQTSVPPPGGAVEHAVPEDLCEPLWPELGLKQDRAIHSGSPLDSAFDVVVDWVPGESDGLRGSLAATESRWLAPAREFLRLRC
jgi:hypothetical protein